MLDHCSVFESFFAFFPPFLHVGLPKNRRTPKSSMFGRISRIKHPFWGTPILGNPMQSIQISETSKVREVYGARATIIDNIASDIRPLDFRAPQAAYSYGGRDLSTGMGFQLTRPHVYMWVFVK